MEAGRATILREIAGVFDVYKIDVDARHLELIADYMVSPVPYRSLYGADRIMQRRSMVDTGRSIVLEFLVTHLRYSKLRLKPQHRSYLKPPCTEISTI